MIARDLSYVLLSAAASVGACLLAWQVVFAVRGRNVSDVGVAMYDHGALAQLAGLATYGAIVGSVLWLPRLLGSVSQWALGSAWTLIALASLVYLATAPFLVF